VRFPGTDGIAGAGTDHAASCIPMRGGKGRRSPMLSASGMLADAMSGGPCIEARASFSAAWPHACVHRLQNFCRSCVRASGGERRLRRIFQAELNHFRHTPPAELRDKRQHEIDARRDATSGQDIAVLHDAAVIDDGAEDREQVPPRPMAGCAAASQKPGCAQNQRSRADRSQITRCRSKPDNLLEKEVVFDGGDAAAAGHQKHVARLDGGQVIQIREREAISGDRAPPQRSHSNVHVGRPREELVRTCEVELSHAVVHRHYYADRLGYRLSSSFNGQATPKVFDRKVTLPYYSAMKAIGCFTSPGFQMLDLAGPAAAFEAANGELESPCYRIHVLAADGGTVTNSLGMAVAASQLDDVALDTLVVIGGRIDPVLSASMLRRIVEASRRCRRVTSVCTGAFTLAAAGLLDTRRATTHWRYAARLQREYPSIRVEADRIFCRDGNVWTSAGITAGIDLALALIEEDHGFAVAKGVAQHLVVYHRRHGGQSQFAASVDLAPKNDRIAATLGYARDHIAEVLTVERLAEAAGMSLRQFSRAFRVQTGATPARVVERLRADLARGRIETTAEPVERIAEAVGFGGSENMRRAFIRIYGHPPQSIRRAVRS